ncbi:tagatose-bisphosphate aldolase [Rhizobium sp. Root73]|uniref:D-tagatose-bisphosphate aldolase, class II, non-catalytic subunit n=1 Tax=unclassified Rhizobium TaxID=2613769 RepID=UPI0007279A2D|nr:MULTISPECIES: D-tagatose-bisphosphate aldolase, class II, non-catalytic subunit [unclassified Rhizobium]KQY16436.1 tagatose-bisphosphate aldolase [Rhizobium sp. Root1334]KRC12809.1 tagatose-bisphosphate aldolase [Rhizobium sp. Root73]
MSNCLLDLAKARRDGRPRGITSVCSAHPTVLRAAVRLAKKTQQPVLIEATCNQVNHLGGYTGMTPSDFAGLVKQIAAEEGLDRGLLIFGGDHLGPNPWRSEDPAAAMEKAKAMVEAYVAAGFSKIHLDASMGCAGEPAALDDRKIAVRAAALCAVAEETARSKGLPMPVYILGTEVPVPGGADHILDTVEPTSPDAAVSTIAIHRDVFEKAGLADAFARTIAFVVQPGVEFGSDNVIEYNPAKAASLANVLENYGTLVFEAHSTDYQPEAALAALVRDGFPILKVGPGVTFAYREALYALDLIATELVPGYGERSLFHTMEDVMTAHPKDWQGHYHGDERGLRLQRHYSYSDRIRYYWNRPQSANGVQALVSALADVAIPETLLHQYLPQFDVEDIRGFSAEDILIASVDRVLGSYDRAVHQSPG